MRVNKNAKPLSSESNESQTLRGGEIVLQSPHAEPKSAANEKRGTRKNDQLKRLLRRHPDETGDDEEEQFRKVFEH